MTTREVFENDRGSPLDDAFRRVIETRAAFSLVVSDGLSERIYYFAIGGLRLTESGPRPSASLAEILVSSAAIGQEAMQEYVLAADGDDRRAAELAVEAGVLSKADHEAALLAKVEEDTLDLFLWENSEVKLIEGQPPNDFYSEQAVSISVSCEVSEFLTGILARVREWAAVTGRVLTGREAYEVVDFDAFPHATEQQRDLIGLLDGTRTLADAAKVTGLRLVQAQWFLLDAIREGSIKRVAGHGGPRLTREQYLAEIEALEEALKVSVEPDIVRRRLAHMLEGADEKARASNEWRILGDSARRRNDLDAAVLCYREAARLVPTDFAVREVILDIYRHKREYSLLVAEGRPLADMLLKHNLLNRAKQLLLQLVGLKPDDTALRRQLIMVLIGLGDKRTALEQLKALARVLEARDAPKGELRDVYLRILALDDKDDDARDRLDVLTGVAAQRRTTKIVIGVAAVLMLCIVGSFAYEGAARKSMGDALAEARGLVAEKDFDGARSLLEGSIARFRFAPAASAGRYMLAEIDRIEAEVMKREGEFDELKEGGFVDGAEDAAEKMAEKARELVEGGNLVDGHRVYSELISLYPWARVLDQISLPLEVTVLPVEARILLNGEEVGQGTAVVHYAPRQRNTLAVEAEGYEPLRRVFEGTQPRQLDLSLHRPVRWRFEGDAAFDAPPLVEGETVYLAGRDRFLTSISSADGSPRWRTPLGFLSDAAVTPVQSDAGVHVATAAGDAYCLDPVTGEVVWREQLGIGTERQPMASAHASMVVPANDGSLMSVAFRDGAVRWTLPPGTVSKGSATVLQQGGVAFVDQSGALSVVSEEDGSVLPRTSPPSSLSGTPVEHGLRIWVWAQDGSLRVFSSDTITELKRFPVPRSSGYAPVTSGGTAYVASSDGQVLALEAAGGNLFPPVKLGERISARPAFANGKLYVPGAKGTLYVLDGEDGEQLWRFDAGAGISAQPVIEDGSVYVVTSDGAVVSLEE